ncbi:hypothetical protein ACFSQ7_33065 [Paenibacillus rhizoplanae]
MLQDSEVKLVLHCMDETDALAGIRKVDLRDKELFLPMSTDNPGVKVKRCPRGVHDLYLRFDRKA